MKRIYRAVRAATVIVKAVLLKNLGKNTFSDRMVEVSTAVELVIYWK